MILQLRRDNVVHAKPDLRVFLRWMIGCYGSVITDIIPFKETMGILDTVQGVISRRVLLNFRIDPEALERVLPKPFKPKIV